jgi:hypothetical protein
MIFNDYKQSKHKKKINRIMSDIYESNEKVYEVTDSNEKDIQTNDKEH